MKQEQQIVINYRQGFILGCAILLLGTASAAYAGEELGRLKLRVLEVVPSNSEEPVRLPVPARVHLSNAAGKAILPEGTESWHDHFLVDGQVSLELPVGAYKIVVEKGPEYRSSVGQIEVQPTKERELVVIMKRITTLRDEGWYSADMHIHRDWSKIESHLTAEDLDFGPVVTWWNQNSAWSGNAIPTSVVKRFDNNRFSALMSGEDERQGGALIFHRRQKPLDIRADDREFPSPMEFVQRARSQKDNTWIDIEKPFWWDVPCWLAHGTGASVGIANNHMCRSEMLENEAWGFPRDVSRLPGPHGNGYWSQELYYHILNAGFRLPPTAGSASGVLPNPVGYNRVYVHTEEDFSPEVFYESLAAGRCFVTNGPLIRVTANGKMSGHEFDHSATSDDSKTKQTVELDIRIDSRDPLYCIEVIQNGKVVDVLPCRGEHRLRLQREIAIESKGWFLVRAICDVDSTFRFGSTAPWYFGTLDNSVISEASVRFFADWQQQRIEQLSRSELSAPQLNEVMQYHLASREFWQTQLAKSEAISKLDDIEESSQSIRRMPRVEKVESQPLIANVQRVVEALEQAGAPLPDDIRFQLNQLQASEDAEEVTSRLQSLLDPLCLLAIEAKAEQPPLMTAGTKPAELIEQGWQTFLIKVVNRRQQRGRLMIESPNALPLPHSPADQVDQRWMLMTQFEGQPLTPGLSGLELEYRIVQIYSRDAGEKDAVIRARFLVDANHGSRPSSQRPGAGAAASGRPSVDEAMEIVRKWRFEDGVDGWKAMNQVDLGVDGSRLVVTSKGNDPYMGTKIEASGGRMRLRFWASTESDGVGQVFWWTEQRPQPGGSRLVNFQLKPGKGQLYEVDLPVQGNLRGIRIDPLQEPGRMEFDWIDLERDQSFMLFGECRVEFVARPSIPVTFAVRDENGNPTVACFTVTDEAGAILPTRGKRLAPDFYFQQQIYRRHGESIALPAGTYTVACSKGPESIPEVKTFTVETEPVVFEYRVKRWIDPAAEGWWSGDHHIHAAGCAHYEQPTQGVMPADMLRHIIGEDLKVGCCLTWGPCFDFQKRFFTGEVAENSESPYLLRYDVEVSGFGSHQSGHLNLLNLKEQIYPGGESKGHWPTLGLNTLRWAKSQGAVCGPAHSALGLSRVVGRVPGTDGMDGPNGLPTFDIPAFDGIGANEFVVDVTHRVPGPDGKLLQAVDFISAMDTDRRAEWNMWYHVLNCGFRVAVSGETDFPCISGERVGLGRTYAQVDGELTFEKWVASLAAGRSYVSDGKVHLLGVGASASDQEVSVGQGQLDLERPTTVKVRLDVSGRLDGGKPINVELIKNGFPVGSFETKADGSRSQVEFEVEVNDSCWLAARVFPHAHSNPIYIHVEGRPIRPSVESARWCLAGVEQCWSTKQVLYAAEEQEDAREAYQHAREIFQQRIDEASERRKP